MGYYTDFTLTSEHISTKDFYAVIEKHYDDESYLPDFEGHHEDSTMLEVWQSSKWSSYEFDMREMSLLFPGVHFQLHGKGEDSEDLWILYALDGKIQHETAEIIYPEFDPEKLT